MPAGSSPAFPVPGSVRMKWTFPRFAILLAIVLLIWFGPSVFGGKVFLPLDLLWQHPPNTPPPGVQGVHNYLIGDMLYENYTWKLWRNRALAAGEAPLWNPNAFCGHPLFTTGQAAVFYPLDVVFLLMPLPYAYVVFAILHLWLAGLFQYAFLRGIGVGGFGAAAGGLLFAMCGFFATKMVFPMLLGSGIWLPLMLLWIVKLSGDCRDSAPTGAPRRLSPGSKDGDEPAKCGPSSRTWRTTGVRIAVGAIIFAMPLLAGFFEIAFYAYITAALFALARCVYLWRTTAAAVSAPVTGPTDSAACVGHRAPGIGPSRRCAAFLGQALFVAVLAAMLTAPQILPFLQVKDLNIRAGQADYKRTVAQGLDAENLLVALAPDIFGNPARHTAWDLRGKESVPIRSRNGADSYYFGTKNYVENGCYMGLLPLLLAPLSLRTRGRHRVFFWFLLALSLAFAFVTPLYALLYHTVPGIKQVRTPFRWLFVSTFAVASLAAIGAEHWWNRLREAAGAGGRVIAAGLILVPLVLLGAVLAVLFVPDAGRLLAERAMSAVPRLRSAFTDEWALAGFLWENAFRFAVFLLAAAAVIALAYVRAWGRAGAALLSLVCLGVLAVDVGLSDSDFNTQSDPAWLDRVPPSVRYLQADRDRFRICRFGPTKVLYPNLPAIYGLQDVGGYDSIILTDYVRYLEAIEPQYLLIYNIVLGFDRPASLDSPLLPLLNIRYMLTAGRIDHPDWELVFDEGMRIYRNRREWPRAFMVHSAQRAASLEDALQRIKSGAVNAATTAVLENPPDGVIESLSAVPGAATSVNIARYRFNTVDLAVTADRPGIVVLCDVMYPGWRAYVDGQPAAILKADGIFRGVKVPAGEHRVSFRFEPEPLRRGMMLLGAGLGIMLALVILPRLRRGREIAAADG